MAAVNPLRYRSYYHDSETGFYYLQSRYYDPEICRFINADSYASTGQSYLGYNTFAYCGNDPVNRTDADGEFWDTVFDIVSLGFSIADVIQNPSDPWAWAGLIGDVVDLVPFVTGVGELTKAAGAVADVADVIDDVHDTARALDNADDVYDAMKAADGIGDSLDAAKDASKLNLDNCIASGQCFIVGTLVLTENGNQAIEDIQVGDLVWAWDENTGDVSLKKVVETYVNETTELTHIFVGGEEIVATPGHPFYSPVMGWTEACELRAGDILVLVNGEYVVVEQVQHELLENPVKVYSFQIADYHTYYVSDNGVLVHNTCRGNAVRKAWQNEQELVRETGSGTRAWTAAQKTELLETGKVRGFVGHHMKSVKGFPDLAGAPSNIQFLTRTEHFLTHAKNLRNITYGRYLA